MTVGHAASERLPVGGARANPATPLRQAQRRLRPAGWWGRVVQWWRGVPGLDRRDEGGDARSPASERRRLFEAAHWRRLAEHRDELLKAAAEFHRVINNCEHYQRTIELVLRFLRNQVGAEEITLFLRREPTGAFEPAAQLSGNALRFGADVDLFPTPRSGQEAVECQVSERTIQATEFTLALSADKSPIGVMKLLVPLAEGADAADLRDILEHMKGLFALSLTKVILRERSITDGLTGLRNKSHFLEQLEERFRHARAHHGGLGLLMLDLDHFKKTNDTFGHLTGDIVLRGVAEEVQARARAAGAEAFRYGGEELNVLCARPALARADLAALAEEIRQAVAARVFRSDKGEPVPATVSIGAALLGPDAANPQVFYDQADQAVYAAKHAGRNRVQFFGDPSPAGRNRRRGARRG